MHGEGEQPLYFLCQLVDVTERRRAEAERRAVQERMQAIIDNSPALVLVKDLEQRYLLVNRRWEEVFGRTGDEVLGKTADEALGDRSPGNDEFDREVIATGDIREMVASARRRRRRGADLPRRQVPAARRRRAALRGLLDRHRHDRAPARGRGACRARGAPGAGPAAGVRRPARGWRGARLQQPALGDPDVRRLRPARAARRPRRPRRHRGDRPRRRPRRGAHAPAAHVQPPRGRHAAASSTRARSCAISSACSTAR